MAEPAPTLGLIPARGGSKSIEYKNIVPFAGLPLIGHVIEAAKRSRGIDRLICSTDDEKIAAVVEKMGVEVVWRPDELARDESHVIDVIKDVIERESVRPDMIPLLQPTSPFLLPSHIDACLEKLAAAPEADSAQTISPFAHNLHAINQRKLDGDRVQFCYPEERERCFNKQSKPKHYSFGNLVVTRTKTVMEKNTIFGPDSVAVEVPTCYAFDLDTRDDIDLGEYYLEKNKVQLPWL